LDCVRWTRICKLLRSPGIDSQPGGPVRRPYLLYWPARLHRLAESIPRNQFLGSLNVYKCGLRERVKVRFIGECFYHGLINYKDTKTKCQLYWCLIEFIDWRYSQSHVSIFDPALWTIDHLTFSIVHLTHPSPLPKVNVQYIQTVCGWEGGGGC
jgi:hypothetical protein